MSVRTPGELPPVAKTLRTAAQHSVLQGAKAQEGHSQSHDSDAAGTCHHYQTVAQSLRSTPLVEQSARQDAISHADMRSVLTIEWSVRRGPAHSQVHSQTAAPPDAELVNRLSQLFATALNAISDSEDRAPPRLVQPPDSPPVRPPAKALRAPGAQRNAAQAEADHATGHSETAADPQISIRAQDLRKR